MGGLRVVAVAVTTVVVGSLTVASATAAAPPGPVKRLGADPDVTKVALHWTNPSSASFAGVTIRRTTGSTPPASPTAGTAVADTGSSATTYTDKNLAGHTTYSYALFAHDKSHHYAPGATKTVSTLAPLKITTKSVPDGVLYADYSTKLVATGGHGSKFWDVSKGAVPDGLYLETNGVLDGQPGTAGTFTFTAEVSDATNHSATKKFTMVVNKLTITSPGTLPTADTQVAYSYQITTSHGSAPLAFSLVHGSLPQGLTLSDTGLLSGTPTKTTTAGFTVQVTDAAFQVASKKFTLAVVSPTTPVITTAAVPNGEVGVGYLTALDAVGGTTALTWTISNGALPAGIHLSPRGVLSGQPGGTGSFGFTVRAADGNGHSSTAAFTISVTPEAPWTQPGSDPSQSGANLADSALTAASVKGLHPNWTAARDANTPAVAGGIMYEAGPASHDNASGEQMLTAYDLPTGAVLWQMAVPCGGPVALTDSLVLVQCPDRLVAYARTGAHAPQWDTKASDPSLSTTHMAVLADRVIVSAYSEVAAFRLSDGHRLWRQIITNDAYGSAGYGLAVAGNVAAVAEGDAVAGIDVATGAVNWTVPDAIDPDNSQPYSGTNTVTAAGNAFFVNLNNQLYALAAATGHAKWHIKPSHVMYQVLGTDGTHVFVSLLEPTAECPLWHFGAYSTQDGTKSWVVDSPSHPYATASSAGLLWLSYSTYTMYCDGSEGGVQVYAPDTGTVIHDLDGGQMVSATPVVADGYLVTGHYGRVAVYGFAPPIPSAPRSVLPTAWTGTTYSATLHGAGGTKPYQWTVTDGSLPAGLTMTSAGVISGTPTSTGETAITVTLTDARGLSAARPVALSVRTAGNGSWPTTAGDAARDGLQPNEDIISTKSYAQVESLWSGDAVQNVQGDVAVVSGRAYLADWGTDGSASEVTSYPTAGTSHTPWHATLDANAMSGVTVAGGVAYVLAGDGLYALDASSGSRLWKAPLTVSQNTTAPLVLNGTAYVTGYDNGGPFIAAFSTTTHAATWAHFYRPTLSTGYDDTFYSALASDGERIFAEGGCEVVAVDAATGAAVWHRVLTLTGLDSDCTSGVSTSVTPLVSGSTVYAGSSVALFALDTATGAVQWQRGIPAYGSLALSNGALVFAGYAGADPFSIFLDVQAVDASDGSALWTTTSVAPASMPRISVAGDLVYTSTTNNQTVALNLVTGAVVWQSDQLSGYPFGSQAAVVNGRIYFVGTDSALHAYGLPQ